MNTGHRLAALTGTAALVATGLTSLAAAPASAATCSRAVVKSETWGKVTYTRCWEGSFTYISGRLVDRDSDDGCYVKVTFTMPQKGGTTARKSYKTGSATDFWTGPVKHVTSVGVKLLRRC
ncbi:hypothetical protein V2W30_15150 [Streptomyces sp. Q6]|uniref:Uncharacterized protein n=1 Tax=Streptomyces citrinus TaxID=3118173 RepID=A0ACD5ABV2_9ACTN